VLVAWGFTDAGERVLLSVMLGMRESHEDWLALGRDLIARGLGAQMLIVADGAPGLIKAIEQCWPASDRQHCAVHRVRNLLAKVPEPERERVRHEYWQALDEAISESDGRQRLLALVGDLDRAGYTAAAKCLTDDLDALVVHLRYPTRHRRRWRSTNLMTDGHRVPASCDRMRSRRVRLCESSGAVSRTRRMPASTHGAPIAWWEGRL
jgi:putative transposase